MTYVGILSSEIADLTFPDLDGSYTPRRALPDGEVPCNAFGFDPVLLAKLAEIPKALEARKPKDRSYTAAVRLHVPAHSLDQIHVSFISADCFGPEVISVDAVLMPMRI